MNRKTLLVLAASRYQVPTILAAKRLGYRVVTTDNVPSNPGHALADKSYGVDTTDKSAVLDIAYKERVDGVISPCTDVAVPTAAYVAQKMSLPGVPLESANIICDKVTFSEFLQQHAFPNPAAYPINYNYQPEEGLFQRPWIIKPDRSSGSKGIFVVRSLADFYKRLPETLSFSPDARGILQEFIEGFQGTCEGVLKQGELALTFVLDRQTVSLPYVATCGHHVPTILSSRLQEKLFLALERMWKILGITEGPFDCDFVATQDEIYIIELSPRIGGNSIATLLKRAMDFDIVEYSVKQACSDPVCLPETNHIRPTALILLGVPEKGYLKYDQAEAEALRKEKWVDSLSMDMECGQPILPFINGRHRVGEAIVFGDDRDDLEEKVVEFKRRLHLRAT